MGKQRTAWKNHLELKTDKELLEVIKTIRIRPSGQNLDQIKRQLNDVLDFAGLEPINEEKRADLYPHLIRRLRSEGKFLFNTEALREACARDKLFRALQSTTTDVGKKLGIRSFYRFAENMDSETDNMLSLLHYFNGRPIKDRELWKTKVLPEIKEFIEREMGLNPKALEFHLDTHMTCAFTAGYFLDPKSGIETAVLQRTPSGRQLWKNTSNEEEANKSPIQQTASIKISETGLDEAFAISIAQMTFDDVISHVKEHVPSINTIHRLEIGSGAGNTKIESGEHATALAEKIRNLIKERRVQMNAQGVIHLFVAAPNAVVFFLGRIISPLGRIQLYEHSFDQSLPTTYVPSIQFPL